MFDHLMSHIRAASQALTSQDAPSQLKLVEAGHELWAAMSYPGEWPADLWEKASRIMDRLLVDGSVQTTVAHMRPSAARDIAQAIFDLAVEVEAARNERLHPI